MNLSDRFALGRLKQTNWHSLHHNVMKLQEFIMPARKCLSFSRRISTTRLMLNSSLSSTDLIGCHVHNSKIDGMFNGVMHGQLARKAIIEGASYFNGMTPFAHNMLSTDNCFKFVGIPFRCKARGQAA